jgi:hypothetical protein
MSIKIMRWKKIASKLDMNSKSYLNKFKDQKNLRCKKMCSMIIKKGKQQYLHKEKKE